METPKQKKKKDLKQQFILAITQPCQMKSHICTNKHCQICSRICWHKESNMPQWHHCGMVHIVFSLFHCTHYKRSAGVSDFVWCILHAFVFHHSVIQLNSSINLVWLKRNCFKTVLLIKMKVNHLWLIIIIIRL